MNTVEKFTGMALKSARQGVRDTGISPLKQRGSSIVKAETTTNRLPSNDKREQAKEELEARKNLFKKMTPPAAPAPNGATAAVQQPQKEAAAERFTLENTPAGSKHRAEQRAAAAIQTAPALVQQPQKEATTLPPADARINAQMQSNLTKLRNAPAPKTLTTTPSTLTTKATTPEQQQPNSKIENHQGWPVDKYMTMTPAVSNLPYYPKDNVPNLSHEEYLLKTDRLFDISKLDDKIYVDEVSSKSYSLLKSKDLNIDLANEVFKTHTENLHKLSDKHDILALLEKPDKDRTSEEKNILFSFSKSGTFLSEFTGEILKHRKENNFPINPNWENQSQELKKKINEKLKFDKDDNGFSIDITASSYPR